MLRILELAYRYRYLDIKHLTALIPGAYSRAWKRVLDMRRAGLINYLHNPTFGRDILSDSQVIEITPEGVAQLSAHGGAMVRADWLAPGNYKQPLHNLNVCLATASIEMACQRQGLRFIPWGEIIALAPEATRKFDKPYVFKVGTDIIVFDNLFSIEYPGEFVIHALELDLSNHGAKEYTEKFLRIEQLIFDGIYKAHLGVTQHMRVLTLVDSPERMNNIMATVPKRAKPYFFKTMPRYGRLRRAPAPAPTILEEWQGANTTITNLGEEVS